MDALASLAAITGSRSGQLIGLGHQAAVPFNWVTDMSSEQLQEFVAVGGGDPRINPRVRAGLAASPLVAMAEADFSNPGERLDPEYADFVARTDIPWICLSNLLRQGELVVGLSVIRSASQGHIDSEGKHLFEAVAPHVQSAVRTQMLLQAQGAELVAGAMEALSMAVFVCDPDGRLRALSPLAEQLLSDGRHLTLRSGLLAAATDPDTRMIRAAIYHAAFSRLETRPPTMLVVRDATGHEPLLVEVATLPGSGGAFGFGVASLLIVRQPRLEETRTAMAAKALFGLTQAETAVAADLVKGLDAGAIAHRAGVSVGTVRTHIRHIFEKAGVRSQAQLVAAITGRL
jgi:DNA-binding CsgD family transcriptional regulator